MNATIALIGNPNTGKSTIFNSLTGMRQHTGNWSGKTVGNACGRFSIREKTFEIVDLPGIYSLNPISEDEKNAVEFIKQQTADISIIVLDATCLERNLILALEVIACSKNVIVCLNLTDEAKRKHINIDIEKLREMLGVPIIATCGVKKTGFDKLCSCIYDYSEHKNIVQPSKAVRATSESVAEIYKYAVQCETDQMNTLDRKIDRIVMSKPFGLPIMFCIIAFIFWLTIVGANYPGKLLESCFYQAEQWLYSITSLLPQWVQSLFIGGMFDTLGCVVSVMLPPMAIFFPLFTLLEDSGYLPRMAFNMDKFMYSAKAHGKMVLTMCMGFGCNAVGVTAARIIDSPRERLIAILTNTFIPCNGRFPTLILIAGLFLAGNCGSFSTALILSVFILSALFITMLISRLLSSTILKGQPSSMVLELPPYRKPQIGSVIVHSIFNRTIYILGRAISVAAPAGIVIWLLQNITVGGNNIIYYIVNFLNPLGKFMGMDGCLLAAFLLGLPANEIVLPLALMFYSGTNNSISNAHDALQVKNILLANGWGIKTAICTMLFSLNHFPCSTTLLTIKKETGSIKWTILSAVIPTVVGVVLCCLVNGLFAILG